MIEQTTRDFRIDAKKPKYGFKGNTIKTSIKGKNRLYSYSLNCDLCHGPCIMSTFYDDPDNYSKYKDQFDPKYHRNFIHKLMKAGYTPETNGICRPYADFKAVSDENDLKATQKEALGYDPESTEFLSRKQKAKVKKQKLREKEAKLAKEEWEECEFGKQEFRDLLKIYKDHKLNIECKPAPLSGLGRYFYTHVFEDSSRRHTVSRFLVVGNRVKGLLPSYEHENNEYYYKTPGQMHDMNLKSMMEFQTKDYVLKTDEKQESDEIQKLIGSILD